MSQDDLDRSILRILQGNGKVSIEEIAEMLGRSPSTIRDRVRRLEEERVILGYSAIVDQDRLDMEAEALVLADIDTEREGKAISALMAMERVSEVMKVTGEPRLMFRVQAVDRRELLRFLDRNIRPLGFRRLDVRMVLERTVRYPGFV
ncbi:MAG: Lrp/AsnC family transcriptional regulator [Methanomassiliicoccales archaeon]|nr:Lrp/AsnC family transcriptional regulator [Methanomassiliicoccales archaeon]